jgi:hypothetical protein
MQRKEMKQKLCRAGHHVCPPRSEHRTRHTTVGAPASRDSEALCGNSYCCVLWLHSHLPRARTSIIEFQHLRSFVPVLVVRPILRLRRWYRLCLIAATAPYTIAFRCDSHRGVSAAILASKLAFWERNIFPIGCEISESSWPSQLPRTRCLHIRTLGAKYPYFPAVHWTHLSDAARVNINAYGLLESETGFNQYSSRCLGHQMCM